MFKKGNTSKFFVVKMLAIIAIGISLFLLSKLFKQTNHDDLKNRQLQLFANKIESHLPTVNWTQSEEIIGRPLEAYNRNKIIRAYQTNWSLINDAIRNKTLFGLDDYFSDQLIEELSQIVNFEYEFIDDRVDLEHNIDLYLFSMDKQLVAFKDRNIRIKKKVWKKDQLLYQEEIYLDYDIVMSFTDSKWKIIQMKRINEKTQEIISTPEAIINDTIVTYKTISDTIAFNKIVDCSSSAQSGYHKIKKGETLYSLSKKYEVSVANIIAWNSIEDIKDIEKCTHLKIQNINQREEKVVLIVPKIKEKKKPRSAKKIRSRTAKPNTKLIEKNLKKIKSIRGINYYPQASPWWDFWLEYDQKIIKKDLLEIRSLGFNTVRIFIPSDGVVHGLSYGDLIDHLKLFLKEAERQKLKVIVTLFDFPVSYELAYYTKSERQLETLLETFKTNKTILAWDLKNEANLDFEIHGRDKVIDWLKYMIERARIYDPNHLLTIGWSNPKSARILSHKLDFISFHYYDDPKLLSTQTDALKLAVRKKPILLQEYGLPSYKKWYNLFTDVESRQAKYIKDMKLASETIGLPNMLWTLHDFDHIPKEVFGYKTWSHTKQKHFGLKTKNGKRKPAYYLFKKKKKYDKK